MGKMNYFIGKSKNGMLKIEYKKYTPSRGQSTANGNFRKKSKKGLKST